MPFFWNIRFLRNFRTIRILRVIQASEFSIFDFNPKNHEHKTYISPFGGHPPADGLLHYVCL